MLEQRTEEISEGLRIGAYRILREIGRGGMGTVYLACRADDAFERLVAIKIIRRGLDTADIIQRFRSERQILATLDHPNIARLLDGGTTGDGLPYFVMEYIEGEPIDVYCDRRKLAIAERLQLFQQVCAAASYAHRHLIVHRDIKSGNILVTNEGVPRLLDFGIAKLLVPGAAGNQTATGLRPLTPEYASPEQVRGEAITTASDVYSLGVLLYLLLTGRRPYRRPITSPAEIERAICEEEPEKPSSVVGADHAAATGSTAHRLRRRFKGDLDNIVLMALRKEPQRRYQSPDGLSEDIARHLSGRPVAARPDSRGYRAAKLLARNKAWAAVAMLIVLLTAGGITAILWEAHAARSQRDLARREQAKAARINAFLQEMVGYSGVSSGTANHQAHDATVADMLEDAANRVETELADQPEVKAEMLGTIGATYMTQAKYALATRYLNEAYALDLKLYPDDARETAGVRHSLADLAFMRGDYEGADSLFQKALPVYRKHVDDADFEIRLMPAMLSDAAFVKRALGKLDEAESLWREALVYGPRLPSRYRGQSIAPRTFLAQMYMDRGDIPKADSLASQASQQLREFGGDRFALAQSLVDLGNVRRVEKRYTEAETSITEGTRLYSQVQGENHPNVAFGLVSRAMVHYDMGRYDLAEQDARGAQRITDKLPAGSYQQAGVYVALGLVLNKTGRSREAEPLLRQALSIRRKAARRANYAAAAAGALGECLATQKKYGEAEPLLMESFETLNEVHVPASPLLQQARERLVALYTACGKTADAARYRP